MTTDTVQQIEKNIQEARTIVEINDSLVRLSNNRDFRLVIKEGYLEKEAIRLVHLKADPFYSTAERQLAIDKDIQAIGGLVSYFRTVAHNASVAQNSIAADEVMLEDLLSEEGGEA